MKDEIIKLINDQLGELPKELKIVGDCRRLYEYYSLDFHIYDDVFFNAKTLLKKETHNRALLAALIESVYTLQDKLEYYAHQVDYYGGWVGEPKKYALGKIKSYITIIEQSLSVNTPISWPDIVKKLEGGEG